jgi:DNA-binding NarL/FixJ family response regulator
MSGPRGPAGERAPGVGLAPHPGRREPSARDGRWPHSGAGAAGGVGYLLKERIADPADFVEAVRRVADGGTAMDPEVVAQLVARRGRASTLGELTPREREVLELMAEGRSNAAIAESLVVTEGAVEKHISNIFGKLGLTSSEGAHRRVLAVLAFLRSG